MMEASAGHGVDASSQDQIKKDREYMTQLRKADPQPFDEMVQFMASLHKPAMALSAKYYELIAIGCATITQCILPREAQH